ncbi:hypothetical protein CEXT_25591 [Caerostris extrusa]|uniref:Uncharacterized protein n=1 Tax=Caerostris extrusa TaxID=172846 RepID=A0AAV4Y6B6_CAEEX|nr:hypothetical protein CEXT_25591 [Caerostris extrusa]
MHSFDPEMKALSGMKGMGIALKMQFLIVGEAGKRIKSLVFARLEKLRIPPLRKAGEFPPSTSKVNSKLGGDELVSFYCKGHSSILIQKSTGTVSIRKLFYCLNLNNCQLPSERSKDKYIYGDKYARNHRKQIIWRISWRFVVVTQKLKF